MKLSDIKPGMRVAYIPGHAHGDINHKDVEHGTVNSVNHLYAFVKFDKQVKKLGYEGTTSQSCQPADLVPFDALKLAPRFAADVYPPGEDPCSAIRR